MGPLSEYLDEQLSRHRCWFSREEALRALELSPKAFGAAALRLTKQQRLVSPHRGFFLILRPEDRVAGAPEPVRWIDPLMNHLGIDYRISLLEAAAYHGSSHQAAMVFQVIAPRQLPNLTVGRHRLEFLYQAPSAFERVNQPGLLDLILNKSGCAKVAGLELTLLDIVRYVHRSAGLNNAAQIIKDLGSKAKLRKLAQAAANYENANVRRLGYLLDHFDHPRQARALLPLAARAKSMKPLKTGFHPIPTLAFMHENDERNKRWKLVINEEVEADF